MPKLNTSQMLDTQSGFTFSGESLEELGQMSDKFTLVVLSVDVSGSTSGFEDFSRKTVEKVIQDCSKLPQRESLLIRVVEFEDWNVHEVKGFTQVDKLLNEDWSSSFNAGGLTPLNDATIEGVESCDAYGKKLSESYYRANALVVVVSDGGENSSQKYERGKEDKIKDRINEIRRSETLDSIKVILVGLNRNNDGSLTSSLEDWKNKVDVDQYVDARDSDSTNFNKLAGFISQSISSTSQAFGTGAPSQNLSF